MPGDLILGIDFGSSSTIAGTLVGDRIQLVQDAGDCVVPSVVYVPDRGPPEIGRRAIARQLTDPSKVIRSVKRVLGLSGSSELVRHYAASVPYKVELTGDRVLYKLRSGDLAPEQLVASILGHVRDLAEARFGGRASKIVMTMSAAAPAGYRDAAVRAAKIAHLEILDLVSEPIAGALALDLHTQAANRRIVVCDFGGGTFDVSAVEQRGLRFTPVATAGDHYLGGDDLDDAIAEAIAGHVFKSARYDMHKDIVRWNELLLRCESAKRQLSVRPEAPIVLREAYRQNGRSHDLNIVLDRPWVDRVWASHFERATGVVIELLRRAGWTANDVDVVGMIGGSSQVPAFAAAIGATLGAHKLVHADNAELAVAQGATLLTARYRSRESSVRVLDVA
jgi:molecular chaperone DnaK